MQRNRTMKLHHTTYKNNYKTYILECIKSEDVFDDFLPTQEQLTAHLFERFYSEYGLEVKRVGKQTALANWLQGLAINIAYCDEDIVDLAIEMGSIEPNPSERMKDKIAGGYWNFMANVIMSFEPVEVTL